MRLEGFPAIHAALSLIPNLNDFTYLLLFPLGVLVGAYGTLIGAGGGFLIVPVLLWSGFNPQQAIGTSLVVVFLNGLSGSFSYARKKRIDFHTGIRFSLWVLPGAVVGVYLSTLFSLKLFSIVFGMLLLGLSIFLIIRPVYTNAKRVDAVEADATWWHKKTVRAVLDQNGDTIQYAYRTASGYAISFFIGFLSSLFGIGGGIAHVPAMIHVLSFPPHIATATSLFILTISAGIGAVAHVFLGNVMAVVAFVLGAGVILGAQIGASIAQRLHARWLVRLLSLALMAIGIRLLIAS